MGRLFRRRKKTLHQPCKGMHRTGIESTYTSTPKSSFRFSFNSCFVDGLFFCHDDAGFIFTYDFNTPFVIFHLILKGVVETET